MRFAHAGNHIRVRLTGILIAAMALASCESGGPASPETASPITLSATALEFSPEQEDRPLRVTNTQGVEIDWFVKAKSASWLSVSPSSGTLQSGASQTLMVQVDRSQLGQGANSGSITFEGGGRTIVLSVTVQHSAGKARASLDPGSLSLGAGDASGAIEVVNSGDAPLDWTMTGPAWVSLDPSSGTVPAGERRQVVVTPDRTALSAGTTTGTLSLASNGGSPSASLSVDVGEAGGLRLEPTTLDFGSSSQELEIRVVNDGGRAVDWSARPGTSWISVSPSTGRVAARSGQSVLVKVDRPAVKKLPSGKYQAAIQFSSDGGSAAASVIVTNPAPVNSPPELSVSPTTLDFGESKTELALDIANSGGQPLDWSASSDAAWVMLTSSSGRVPANESQSIGVRVSRSKLSPGTHHTASIQVASNGGSASTAVTVKVPSTPPSEDPPAEDPPSEDPPSEDPPSEDPPSEDPPSEDPPSEDPPSEDDDSSLSSIDATGTKDVTDELNAYLASVPDGSVIHFPAGARYRVEGVMRIFERRNLTIEGNGAMIFAITDGSGVTPPKDLRHLWPRQRSHVEIMRSENIVVRNLVVKGANPNAGAGEGAYVAALEGQHGFDIRGSHGVRLENVTATDTYGDFVYFGGWSSNVRVVGGHFERSGRQGFAITAASDVVVEGAYIGEVGRTMVDIEPLGPKWGAHNITFRSNTFGYCRHLWVSSGGRGGNVDGILFENNRLQGMDMKVKVQDDGGEGRRGSHAFINNVSDDRYSAPVPAFTFRGIDGVKVIGNVHQLGARERGRRHDVLVYACNSTSIEVHGNDAEGFTDGELKVDEECGT